MPGNVDAAQSARPRCFKVSRRSAAEIPPRSGGLL